MDEFDCIKVKGWSVALTKFSMCYKIMVSRVSGLYIGSLSLKIWMISFTAQVLELKSEEMIQLP